MIHWNVYVENINKRCIEKYDIFGESYLADECRKMLKKYGDNRERFLIELRHELMYRYWSKCEWEIILDSWPPMKNDSFHQMKIDVFDQINMNWDAFAEYVWNHRKEI